MYGIDKRTLSKWVSVYCPSFYAIRFDNLRKLTELDFRFIRSKIGSPNRFGNLSLKSLTKNDSVFTSTTDIRTWMQDNLDVSEAVLAWRVLSPVLFARIITHC